MAQEKLNKGFRPYLAVVFLNAFVDLGHKIIIQNTIFKIYDGQQQIILTAIVNALILIPFIFLFSPSGYLSDRYQKNYILRYGALLAVVATLLVTASYYSGNFWQAFLLTLLLAAQSAIYSPAKYGYIKELVGDEHIAKANAFVQAITIVAILGGTFVFSILFELLLVNKNATTSTEIFSAIAPLGWLLVILASTEFLISHFLPKRSQPDIARKFQAGKYLRLGYLSENLKAINQNRVIWYSILGLAVFWSLSQVMLAAFPAYAKEILVENNTVIIQGILACSGIGIMLGSLLAGKISRAHIELGLVPIGAVGMALGVFLLTVCESRIMMALLFIAIGFSGGIFIVPLNALIQYTANEKHLGTVLAGNNWLQNVSMVAFLGLTVFFAVSGMSSVGLFYILTFIAVVTAIYSVKELPHSLARILASVVIKRRYKIDVEGFENLPKTGATLLLGNHISWIDWLIVQIACPRPVHFVMIRSIYQKRFLKPIFDFFGVIPISRGSSRQSLEIINEYLKQGKVVCLFPEGAISRNGHLGEFQRGFERVVDDVDGVIVPFYLRGLWGSWFSRSASDKLRRNSVRGIKRDIIVAFGEPLSLSTSAEELKQKVFELSISAWSRYTDTLDPLPYSWLKAAKRNLSATAIVDNNSGDSLSNARMIAATLCFAKAIKKQSPEKNIGLLLPSSAVGIISNIAVMLNGQTAVNLNYSSSASAVSGAIKNADIKTVYTSERFVEKLKKKNIDVDSMLENCNVIYLEQFKENIKKINLIINLVKAYLLPVAIICRLSGKSIELDDPAVILFSSGSEGVPKGIVLSHRNIMGNIKQISDVLNTQEDDVVMGSLPLFHSFGLTVTSLMPLTEGLPVVCHPDPTDVGNIAKAVAKNRATILCATATFLNLFARNSRVKPLMLDSLRVVVAGAEKLTEEVRENFQSKFNKEIFEGYGATETTPVASVNVPDKLDTDDWKIQAGQRRGTVGLPLPGSCFRIVDPETFQTLPIGEDGMILISGTQVMLGYLKDPEKTNDAILNIEGRRWYKTGDKGHLDADGFLTIVDRYSRFAKIAGEMISLSVVEENARRIISTSPDGFYETFQEGDLEILATNIPDAKKGEAIVLLINTVFDTVKLKQQLISQSENPMLVPQEIIIIEEIPKLGSGKTDYNTAKNIALKYLEAVE